MIRNFVSPYNEVMIMIKNILKFIGKGLLATIGTSAFAISIVGILLIITDMWKWVIKAEDKVAE